MSNPTTAPLSVDYIESKLNEIQTDITGLKTEINRNPVSSNTVTKLQSLKSELQNILDTINKISGSNTSLETYINSLINDMTNSSLKDSFYTIQSDGSVKSTDLLKAELIMIRQLDNQPLQIITKFGNRLSTVTDRDNIKKAIKDADSEIDL